MNSNSSREEIWSSQTLLLDLDMEGANRCFCCCWRFKVGLFCSCVKERTFLFWCFQKKQGDI